MAWDAGYVNPLSGLNELGFGQAGSNYVILRAWQPSSLSFVTLTLDASGNLNVTGGGGGGGGAVTIADGADVTQGAISDALVFGDSSGTISAKLRGISAALKGNGAPLAPATASVTSASSTVLAANASRRGLVIVNVGTVDVYFGCGTAAAMFSGIILTPYGTWVMDRYTFTTASLSAICTSASTLSIQEYQ